MTKKKAFREPDIDRMADLIQWEVAFFNGWSVDKKVEREACEKAARKIQTYLSRRAAREKKS